MTRPDTPHYTQGDIECIDAIRAALGDEAFVDHCRACALKYLWRARHKSDLVADLRKARAYIDFALEGLT